MVYGVVRGGVNNAVSCEDIRLFDEDTGEVLAACRVFRVWSGDPAILAARLIIEGVHSVGNGTEEEKEILIEKIKMIFENEVFDFSILA